MGRIGEIVIWRLGAIKTLFSWKSQRPFHANAVYLFCNDKGFQGLWVNQTRRVGPIQLLRYFWKDGKLLELCQCGRRAGVLQYFHFWFLRKLWKNYSPLLANLTSFFYVGKARFRVSLDEGLNFSYSLDTVKVDLEIYFLAVDRGISTMALSLG